MGQPAKDRKYRRQILTGADVCFTLSQYLVFLTLAILIGLASAQSLAAQTCAPATEPPQQLSAHSGSRNLKAKEMHVFTIDLSPGDYVQVVVDQKGIDVVVRLFDPNRNLLVERDSPNSRYGPEKVSLTAQSEGSHQLEVCGFADEPAGTYTVTLEGPRTPDASDKKRARAVQGFSEASRLIRKGTESDTKEAIRYYTGAAEIWKELNDSNEEGYARCLIGEAYRSLRDLKNSETNLQDALARLQNPRDPSGQAYVLNAMGATYRDLSNDPRKAIEYYEQAIPLYSESENRWGEAQLRNNVGLTYQQKGEHRQALEHLNRARKLWVELGIRGQEINTLLNLAISNVDLGDLSVAYPQYQEVLQYCKDTSNCDQAPHAHNGLGMIYDTWGQTDEAVIEFNLALQGFKQITGPEAKDSEATVLDNVGMLYAVLGDAEKALDNFEKALNLRRELKVPGKLAATLSNFGYAMIIKRQPREALEKLNEALPLSQGTTDRFEGYTHMRLGMAYFNLEDTAKALEHYGKGLEILTRIGEVRGRALTLHQIGDLYSSIDQAANARSKYREAEKIWQSLKDAQGEALSLYGLAKLERRQNKLIEARQAITSATAKVESLRTSMSSYRLRKVYFEARHDFYELEVDIRMRLYYSFQARKKFGPATAELEAALFASERARSRNLLDLLSEAKADIRGGVAAELLKQESEENRQIVEKLDRLQSVIGHKDEVQTKKLQGEIDELKESLEKIQTRIRVGSPLYSAITKRPLEPYEIQQQLDNDTCLLQYAVGEDRSYLWLVTKDNLRPYLLPGRAEIQKAVAALLDVIRVHEPLPEEASSAEGLKNLDLKRAALVDYPKRAIELSNMVLKPVGKLRYQRIVIVADGALQFVPFNALPAPGEVRAGAKRQNPPPLIANHDVVFEPSASVLALIRNAPRRTAANTVAVIADPVFSQGDKRVQLGAIKQSESNAVVPEDNRYLKVLRDAGDVGSANGTRLLRLTYSRKEAESILAVAPSGSTMAALDFDANRAQALSAGLQQFRIIHFATHGILDTSHPELSGLVFSLVDRQGQPERGFVRLNDIYNLNLPVELVVLSACRTAIGQEAIGQELKSEGLSALTRGFMHAGAERVIASLWKVDDEATAELMKRFYDYHLDKKMPASAALRKAQLEISESDLWRDAFYWAGFVLQGEWN